MFRGGPSNFLEIIGGVNINFRNIDETRGGHGKLLKKIPILGGLKVKTSYVKYSRH